MPTAPTSQTHVQTAAQRLRDGSYELVDGRASFLIGNITVCLSQTDEGVVCDMYPAGQAAGDSLASTYAFFSEAEALDEDAPSSTSGA